MRPDDMSSFPQPRELSPEELKEAYALSMGAFTAEDLQRFTELDSGVPALDVLREAEEEMDKHDEQCG